MLRKFAAALVVAVLTLGAAFAEEIKGTFVKFADGKLTVKVEDKEKEFKVPADLKIKQKTKDGDKEVPAADILGKAKADAKLTLEVEKDTVKGFKFEGKKKTDK